VHFIRQFMFLQGEYPGALMTEVHAVTLEKHHIGGSSGAFAREVQGRLQAVQVH
jgi:hypothetical protein